MGLVRLHLMELAGDGQMAPTGRVVAFANSIIFQASGGLFKQIAGVNLAWHEVTFSLPTGADYAALKDKMVEAVTRVIADYREDIVRQTREIQKAASCLRDWRSAAFGAAALLGVQRRCDRALPGAAVARCRNRRARLARAAERHLGAHQRCGLTGPANQR